MIRMISAMLAQGDGDRVRSLLEARWFSPIPNRPNWNPLEDRLVKYEPPVPNLILSGESEAIGLGTTDWETMFEYRMGDLTIAAGDVTATFDRRTHRTATHEWEQLTFFFLLPHQFFASYGQSVCKFITDELGINEVSIAWHFDRCENSWHLIHGEKTERRIENVAELWRRVDMLANGKQRCLVSPVEIASRLLGAFGSRNDGSFLVVCDILKSLYPDTEINLGELEDETKMPIPWPLARGDAND